MASTNIVLYVPFRDLSGVYVGSGVTNADATTSAKSMLPPQRVLMVDKDGYCNPQWYRYFDWLTNQKLGGVNAPNISDIVTTVTTAQAAVTATATTVSEVIEQATQNAAALDTIREVAQTSALTGADQIPSVARQLKSAY